MQPRAFLVYLAALVRAATNRPPLHKVTPLGPGHLRLHAGSPPPGAVDDRVLWEVTRDRSASAVFLAGPRRLWPGERLSVERSCWSPGLRSPGKIGCPGALACWRRTVLTALGAAAGRDAAAAVAGQRLPQPSGGWAVLGSGERVVTKRAARVRVLFDMGIPRLTWCRLRSETGSRSTSLLASTGSPGRMSGPVPGRSSGSSVSIRAVAGSQSRRSGRHERRWWRPSWPCGGHPSRSPGGCRWPIPRSR